LATLSDLIFLGGTDIKWISNLLVFSNLQVGKDHIV